MAGNRREGIDYGALEAYAEARALPLTDAAQLLLNSLAAGRELLMRTERIKDRVLARIDAIKTLNDVRVVEGDAGGAERMRQSSESLPSFRVCPRIQ